MRVSPAHSECLVHHGGGPADASAGWVSGVEPGNFGAVLGLTLGRTECLAAPRGELCSGARPGRQTRVRAFNRSLPVCRSAGLPVCRPATCTGRVQIALRLVCVVCRSAGDLHTTRTAGGQVTTRRADALARCPRGAQVNRGPAHLVDRSALRSARTSPLRPYRPRVRRLHLPQAATPAPPSGAQEHALANVAGSGRVDPTDDHHRGCGPLRRRPPHHALYGPMVPPLQADPLVATEGGGVLPGKNRAGRPRRSKALGGFGRRRVSLAGLCGTRQAGRMQAMVSTNASPISFPQTPHYRQFARWMFTAVEHAAKAKLRDIAHSDRAAAWQEGQCRTIVNELLAAISSGTGAGRRACAPTTGRSCCCRRRIQSRKAPWQPDAADFGRHGHRPGGPAHTSAQTSVLLTLGATVGLVRAVGDRLHEIGEHQLVAEMSSKPWS